MFWMRNFIFIMILFSAANMLGPAMAQSKALVAGVIQRDLLNLEGMVETRQVKDPQVFRNYPAVREAYAAARAIPSVMDKLFCYCYCEANPRFNHNNLLTCFTNDHASQCDVCISQAMTAKEMTEKGKTPMEIAERFKSFYIDAQRAP